MEFSTLTVDFSLFGGRVWCFVVVFGNLSLHNKSLWGPLLTLVLIVILFCRFPQNGSSHVYYHIADGPDGDRLKLHGPW